MNGTIKFFNDEKGFGMITPAGGGADILVHITGFSNGVSLPDGTAVSYDEGNSGGRKQAINVQRA